MRNKLLSLALALALCLGMTVPAFAAELKFVEVPAPTVVVEEYEGTEYSYEVSQFEDGLAWLTLYDANGDYISTGIVDETYKVVVPPGKYRGYRSFSEGFSVVNNENGFGLIDRTGKEVIPCQYPRADYFYPGDPTPHKFNPLGDVHDGMVCLLKDGKYGYLDTTGKEVVPCQYRTAFDFSEGLARVEKDGKWGFIDKTGKEVIPLIYDNAVNFHEGLAAVGVYEEGLRFIDTTGKTVISLSGYDEARFFSEGLAAVRKGSKWGFIDKTGKLVIPCQFDQPESGAWHGTHVFSEGLAAVYQNGKYGYIDTTGKLVVPCKYNLAFRFSGNYAVVRTESKEDGNICGLIDRTGKELIPLKIFTGEDGKEYSLYTASTWPYSDDVFTWWMHCLTDDTNSYVYLALTVDAKVSGWAREQVDRAAVKGLMPEGLPEDFTANITRAQFAAAAVKLYEAMSGQAAPAPGQSPFSDTSDPAVIQAEALGIVSGVGGGKFAPGDPVTRQEAALMLSRVYTKLGGAIPEVEKTAFADNGDVASWARDAVAFMSGREIVNGVGNNKFDPKGSASIEQALIIALRMLENLDAA